MQGAKQVERSVWIDATPKSVWAVLEDSAQLSRWAPPVQCVEAHDASERVGSARTCAVTMGGREGTMVERCVGRVDERELSYRVDEESFGMTKMFADYGFRIRLAPERDGTRVSIETFYSPRNVFYGAMNVLMMRRRFGTVVDGLLDGLRRHVEA